MVHQVGSFFQLFRPVARRCGENEFNGLFSDFLGDTLFTGCDQACRITFIRVVAQSLQDDVFELVEETDVIVDHVFACLNANFDVVFGKEGFEIHNVNFATVKYTCCQRAVDMRGGEYVEKMRWFTGTSRGNQGH